MIERVSWSVNRSAKLSFWHRQLTITSSINSWLDSNRKVAFFTFESYHQAAKWMIHGEYVIWYDIMPELCTRDFWAWAFLPTIFPLKSALNFNNQTGQPFDRRVEALWIHYSKKVSPTCVSPCCSRRCVCIISCEVKPQSLREPYYK